MWRQRRVRTPPSARLRPNDTLKPSGAVFKEAVGLYGWTASLSSEYISPGEQSRPRLNVGR